MVDEEKTRTADVMESGMPRFRSDAFDELLAHSEPLYDWQRRVLRAIEEVKKCEKEKDFSPQDEEEKG